MSVERVAIITGGSSGIGFNATKKLVERGVHCIIASRDEGKVNKAVETIKTETGRDNVEGKVLDLCDFNSIRAFVEEFKDKKEYINNELILIIKDAGIHARSRQITACGLESTFVANYLGHFLLTNLLLDTLKANTPSRVVVVGSNMHDPNKGKGSNAILTLETFNFDNNVPFDGPAAYRFSKLATVWFTYHLSSILQGSGVIVNCLEPGFIPETNLNREFPCALRFIIRCIGKFIKEARTLEHGGDCVVDLSLNPLITTSGNYYEDKKVSSSSERSHNVEERQRMWDYSARVVGL